MYNHRLPPLIIIIIHNRIVETRSAALRTHKTTATRFVNASSAWMIYAKMQCGAQDWAVAISAAFFMTVSGKHIDSINSVNSQFIRA